MAGKALVIGGGAAGLQAAWGIVSSGSEVTLVEKEVCLGGNLSHNKYLFPLREEAFSVLGQRFSELSKSPRFRLMLHSEIAHFSAREGVFEARISTRSTFVDTGKCTLCGDCVKACPVEYPDSESLSLTRRKAVHHNEGLPPSYSIERRKCPAGCQECARACKTGAVVLDQKPHETTEKFDSVVVATGIVPYDLGQLKELGYGRSPNIITGLEFEILYRPKGPTGGEILRPGDGQKPRTVAILTCVGSRDEKHRPYCCQVGCMNALNQAFTIKEKLGNDADVYIAFTDIRAHGKFYEEFYRKVRGLQVKMIRGKPSEVYIDYDGTVYFDIFDTATHKLLKLKADLIVLEPALVNAAPQLEKLLGIALDREGFFAIEGNYSLPVTTSVPGIFLAGTASGPRDVVSAMANASAAAIGASTYMKERAGK